MQKTVPDSSKVPTDTMGSDQFPQFSPRAKGFFGEKNPKTGFRSVKGPPSTKKPGQSKKLDAFWRAKAEQLSRGRKRAVGLSEKFRKYDPNNRNDPRQARRFHLEQLLPLGLSDEDLHYLLMEQRRSALWLDWQGTQELIMSWLML